jgi:hypothetical protein
VAGAPIHHSSLKRRPRSCRLRGHAGEDLLYSSADAVGSRARRETAQRRVRGEERIYCYSIHYRARGGAPGMNACTFSIEARMHSRLGRACTPHWSAHALQAGARMHSRLERACTPGWGAHAPCIGVRMHPALGCVCVPLFVTTPGKEKPAAAFLYELRTKS